MRLTAYVVICLARLRNSQLKFDNVINSKSKPIAGSKVKKLALISTRKLMGFGWRMKGEKLD